jgi:pyrroline-5-carboxylate reductase
MSQLARLLLVGCGNMGSALLSRILSQPLFQAGIDIITPQRRSAEAFLGEPRVKWYLSPQDLPHTPDVIIFAVKPYQLDLILPQYKHLAQARIPFITVAAGKALSFYQHYLGQDVRLIRIMPNTPVAIGCGQTLAYAADSLTSSQRKNADLLLHCFGEVYWMASEEKLDRAAVLTGCGPAYVYRFIEGLAHAAQHLGIDSAEAMTMTKKMVAGAVQYLDKSHKMPEELRNQVTSPGGITAAALRVLDRDDALDRLLTEALVQAYKKEQ